MWGPETRARILAAAEELEYSASELGMALATGSTRTVGIVLPSFAILVLQRVASGASDVLSNAGLRIELINLDIDSDFLQIDSEQFARLFRQLGAGRSRDALLFARHHEHPEDGGRALVPVAAHGAAGDGPGVFVDHWEGGRLVAERGGLGHCALAMVDGRMPEQVDASIWEQRSAGFLAGVADSVSIGHGPSVAAKRLPSADGEQIGQDLLASPDSLPSAVFCHSDELAFGLIASLRRGGVHCPQDISVAGFDDLLRWHTCGT